MATNTHSAHFVTASSQSLTDGSIAACQPSSLTLEAWIKPGVVTSRNDIFVKKNAGGFYSYLFTVGQTSGKLTAQFRNGASYVQTDSVSSITASVWTHIAMTYDGTTCKIYINGNATPDQTATLSQALAYSGTNPVIIGGEAFFGGEIDEVRIWNTIRTGAEINANYNKQLIGNESGLVSYWQLNNALTDKTSNANTLTNTNAVTFTTDTPFTYDYTVSLSETVTGTDTRTDTFLATLSDTVSASDSVKRVRRVSNQTKHTSTWVNQQKS